MLKGINVNQRIEFTSKHDTEEPKTVFVFKPLTTEAMMDFVSDSTDGQLKLSGEKLFSFLGLSIIEIKNFGEENETVVNALKRLPPMVIVELVEEAVNINKMTGQDSKN